MYKPFYGRPLTIGRCINFGSAKTDIRNSQKLSSLFVPLLLFSSKKAMARIVTEFTERQKDREIM